MANQEHLDILKQGVEIWNRWREENSSLEPDLSEVDLTTLHLEHVDFTKVHLERADLSGAHLERAKLIAAHLEQADLEAVHLEQADLEAVHLEGAYLYGAHLQGTDLHRAFFDAANNLYGITLSDKTYGTALLADVHWGEINLAVVDWVSIKMLGDEQMARRTEAPDGKKIDRVQRLEGYWGYRAAVRTNRQLAAVLRDQGLNEEADHFAYRARLLQRIVLRWQRKFGQYLFSGFLDLLAGYGYRPLRSIIAYLLIITIFAVSYYFLGQREHLSLSYLGSLVYSVTSFHGRGFFPGPGITSLDDAIIRLAAVEAVIGLFIEISFIATFTQRFFGK